MELKQTKALINNRALGHNTTRPIILIRNKWIRQYLSSRLDLKLYPIYYQLYPSSFDFLLGKSRILDRIDDLIKVWAGFKLEKKTWISVREYRCTNAHFSPFFKFWFLFLSFSIVKIWKQNWNFDTICIIWKHIQRYQTRLDTLMCSLVILKIK